jgi:predicted SAM-dependent methyltransferase/rubredoxin
MANQLKKIIPRFVKNYILKQINSPTSPEPKIDEIFFCPVCKQSVSHFNRLADFYLEKFDEYGHIFSPFTAETLNVFRYSCPKCGASDRDRLMAIFLDSNIKITDDIKIIEFAPSLQKFFKSFNNINYRTADLFMPNVDDQVDITKMTMYENKSFDLFICSHILEHIEDDIAAMSELYRILKDRGKGVVLVPIQLVIEENYENSEYKTEEQRWKHFGQNDHVRYYSRNGLINRLNQVGFKVELLGINHFGKDQFIKNGIHPRSILYIVEK